MRTFSTVNEKCLQNYFILLVNSNIICIKNKIKTSKIDLFPSLGFKLSCFPTRVVLLYFNSYPNCLRHGSTGVSDFDYILFDCPTFGTNKNALVFLFSSVGIDRDLYTFSQLKSIHFPNGNH